MLTLLTGGARSGKSSTAARLASRVGEPVVFVATAQALDEEMTARIDRHRADRPLDWTTIEAPVEVGHAIREVTPQDTLIVDCLALWTTNILDRADAEIAAAAEELVAVLKGRTGETFVVTNEVGSSIVPDNTIARRFRDVLGTVNQIVGGASDRCYLCVAGGVVEIHDV